MADTTGHVHFRTTPEIKQKISDAAALLGQSITDFIESAASERAQTVLAKQTLVLTNDERDRFLAALENPAAPTDAMQTGAERVMRAVRSGVLEA